jgi:glycosyltransferase involved in cell wall biosynthesis
MKFTVATCTYNRVHTLPLVYQSLLEQTYRDFEWVIVDDGSTDDTKAVVDNWIASSPFLIRYFYQENQHKKVAFNKAVKEANGELLLNWDSDDGAVPEALQTFAEAWESIPKAESDSFVGVTCLCKRADGTTVGDEFPSDPFDSDTLESSYVLKIRGEKWGFQRRDVLLSFPFPDSVPGLVPEGYVWNQIALEYKTRFINAKLRIYNITNESLTGAMKNFGQRQILEGVIFYHRHFLDEISPVLIRRGALKSVLICAVQYGRLHLNSARNGRSSPIRLKRVTSKLIVASAFPMSFCRFILDTLIAFGRSRNSE